jgi:hypothetical protein
MKLSIHYSSESTNPFVSGASRTPVSEALGSLIGLMVDLDIPDNSGYPDANVYVVRVDEDGDLVVSETDERGAPIEGMTWAVPQAVIRNIYVPLGEQA